MKGGARQGAGRPKGTGKFGEETRAIRVPSAKIEAIYQYLERTSCPFYENLVPAGFPSPAEHISEKPLDISELLIKRPAATFFVRVSGLSMINAGIHEGDILVVDRSLTPVNGKVVIAVVDGELTVKRFAKEGGRIFLRPENEDYAPIEMKGEIDMRIFGVVTYVIHAL